MIHISFNVIGTLVFLILFYGVGAVVPISFMARPADAVGVAMCHSVFNLCTTALLLPFSRQLEKLACTVIRTERSSSEFAFLDPRLLRTPSVAVSECGTLTRKMADLARQNLLDSLAQLDTYDEKREQTLLENEDRLDLYEDRLGSYLVSISQHGISQADSREAAKLLHAIGDFERIGDHALNIQESAREIRDKALHFSAPAQEELKILLSALRETLDTAFASFDQSAPEQAVLVEPLEETVDRLTEEIRLRHIERLQSGQCTIQMGFILNDLLTNVERVSDHCSNIAVCVLEAARSGLNAHSYLHEVKEDAPFREALRGDLRKYHLPRVRPADGNE